MGRGFGVVVIVGYLVLALNWLATDATTRILLDTDMDTDDFFALLYLLKQNRSVIDVKAVTINTNSWTDAGHAVNHLYDLLYMMNRDDIAVGVGGEGGISSTGTISPNVGGYHPLIEQGTSTVGYCRYRQAIPPGRGGRLDIDTNFGLRRGFLPQGSRKYSPLQQATAQEVMINTISAGPTTVFIIGAHTNFAILLMTHPELKKNIQHIFVMGGGVRSKNPTGCCLNNSSPCIPIQCGDVGNLFSAYTANPYAEFNMFCDPFSAYQVFHSGIPITLVPLDATNTIPITKEFFQVFEKSQSTYEAQYCFQSLQIVQDTWFDTQFYQGYFMWDSFMSGVAVSIIENGYKKDGYNDFAIMQYMNITVITSNEPYGIHDGSNPFFDGHNSPMFNLNPKGIHSGHVQMGIQDPFCYVNNGTEIGKCQDGYTKEATGIDSVRVLVAQQAKPNQNSQSNLNREFFKSYIEALNRPQQSGRYTIAKQFPFNKEVLQKPNLVNKNLGKPVIFDMDMSAGDFLSLIYLLKIPVEIINLKGILVNGNGWANPATIDIVYDILHMMGRDDIPVGLGSVSPIGTSSMDCKYVRYIPQGSGGYIDSDTLFGFGRNLPRSPRRYSADNSMVFGAPRNTSHPELRQPLAMEVWKSITMSTSSQGFQKVTILSNGPLTNVANIILSNNNASKAIQDIYIVGGHVSESKGDTGNVFTVPSNLYSEFNFFLDPLAAKIILQSKLHITLIPLTIQRTVSSLSTLLGKLQASKVTPESAFTYSLFSTWSNLQKKSPLYKHVDIFLGEILGAAILVNDPTLRVKTKVQRISIVAGGNDLTKYGQLIVDNKGGRQVTIIDSLDTNAYYSHFTSLLNAKSQFDVKGSMYYNVNLTSNET